MREAAGHRRQLGIVSFYVFQIQCMAQHVLLAGMHSPPPPLALASPQRHTLVIIDNPHPLPHHAPPGAA